MWKRSHSSASAAISSSPKAAFAAAAQKNVLSPFGNVITSVKEVGRTGSILILSVRTPWRDSVFKINSPFSSFPIRERALTSSSRGASVFNEIAVFGTHPPTPGTTSVIFASIPFSGYCSMRLITSVRLLPATTAFFIFRPLFNKYTPVFSALSTHRKFFNMTYSRKKTAKILKMI